jgi:cell wall-associated NlpC family hydrolase
MTFDSRLTPARPDLAAAHLRGKVEAPRFVEGRSMRLRTEIADLRRDPALDAPIDTQILYGEDVTLYDEHEGWAWVQLAGDGYVGYTSRDALIERAAPPTHRVNVNRTLIYPAPNMKLPVIGALPRGATVRTGNELDGFVVLAEGGFVFAAHLTPLAQKTTDFVTIAEELIGSPYLWGGKSSLGIDCSGLIQIALMAAGHAAPRDTDLQQAALGRPLPTDDKLDHLARGDLIFWKGHVGVMRDARTLLHANAHHMLVASEPLAEARARVRQKGAGDITSIKRM